jgi:uncharacterized membrane protein
MRLLHRFGRTASQALLCICAVSAVMPPGRVSSEIYSSDSSAEISGSGPRSSRSCTVLLKPAMTFGDDLAPRLVLTTNGQSRLSFGIQNAGAYADAVIVQDNMRKPFAGSDNASADQFLASDLSKALGSKRLFFVTARRGKGGRYVSSRYEAVDFDAVLTRLEAACPFDAESLMADTSQRQKAEQALALSTTDLTFIRWSLNKRYGGPSGEPDSRSALSQTERSYLKRYAADNNLPISQYLTASVAQRLIADGKSIAEQAKTVAFEVCNQTLAQAAVAVAARQKPDSNELTLSGWRIVDAGACKTLGSYGRGKIYVMAEANNGGGGWYGSDVKYCVERPGPFERTASPGSSCLANGHLVGFQQINANGDKYTWTLDRPPAYSDDDLFAFQVCNKTPQDAAVAVAARKDPSANWLDRGWWLVGAGACRSLGKFAKGRIYATAVAQNSTRGWYGNDIFRCVEFPGPFERTDDPNHVCPPNSPAVGFHDFMVTDANYTWSLYGPPTFGEHEFFDFEVCNKSGALVSVAVMGRPDPDSPFTVVGYNNVAAGACDSIGKYAKGTFFASAFVYGNTNRGWWRNDIKLCVAFPGPFRRVNTSDYVCRGNEKLMPFEKFIITNPKFRWTLT